MGLGEWGVVRIRGLASWAFRSPSPLEAGVHGPGVSRASFSYPMPSTIAGLMAFTYYSRTSAKPSDSEDFKDLREVLEKLTGRRDFLLRPGFVGANNRVYAYIGLPEFPEINRLKDSLRHVSQYYKSHGMITARVIDNALKEAGKQAWAPARMSRTGIALERSMKTAAAQMIFSVEQVEYLDAEVLVYLNTYLDIKGVYRFGGEARLAAIYSEKLEPNRYIELVTEGQSDYWTLMLTTPALLEIEEIPSEWSTTIDTISKRTSEKLSKALANTLLHEAKCFGDSRLIYIPKKCEIEMNIIAPGWSLAIDKPREPHLLIPPGSIIITEAPRSCIEKTTEKGIGKHSELGWGSLIAVSY